MLDNPSKPAVETEGGVNAVLSDSQRFRLILASGCGIGVLLTTLGVSHY